MDKAQRLFTDPGGKRVTKRRRLPFLILAGGLLALAFGPALLILAGAAPDPTPAGNPSAPAGATMPAIMPRAIMPRAIMPRAITPSPGPTLTPDRRPRPSLAACEVSAGRVFLRAEPRRASRALGVMTAGDLLTILPTPPPPGARWLPVQSGALAGWIYSDYCKPLEAIK